MTRFDLGDFRDNPDRIGAYVLRREPKFTEIGLTIRANGRSPIMEDDLLTVRIDGRPFTGRVVTASRCRCLLSTGYVDGIHIITEGKFTQEVAQ